MVHKVVRRPPQKIHRVLVAQRCTGTSGASRGTMQTVGAVRYNVQARSRREAAPRCTVRTAATSTLVSSTPE